MSRFTEQVEAIQEPLDIPLDEFLDWLESLYNFCIPENKEVGEHAFNVLDYQYMEQMGSFFKLQYEKVKHLEVKLKEALEDEREL